MYLPVKSVILNINDINKGVMHKPIHNFTKFPVVYLTKTQITIKIDNCCKNVLNDASAGLWSAISIIFTVLRTKFKQKYIIIIEAELFIMF